MRLLTPLILLLFYGPTANALTKGNATPTVFAPGVIAGTADDGAAAFTPDGATVIFMRGSDGSTLVQSKRVKGVWSTPLVAPFSGRWHDLDPAMAPDGSFLLFVSNRPAAEGGSAIDAVRAGKRRPGAGMNLWRVNRQNGDWGSPARLPDTVNFSSLIASPSVAADGTLYFIGWVEASGDFKLLESRVRGGEYATPRPVVLGDEGDAIRDPAIAPDRSFIVVSVKNAPDAPYRLAIALRTKSGWGPLRDLGTAVNADQENMGAQLGPDHRTLYFYSNRRLPSSSPDDSSAPTNGRNHIWQVSLAPWLDVGKRIIP